MLRFFRFDFFYNEKFLGFFRHDFFNEFRMVSFSILILAELARFQSTRVLSSGIVRC